MFDTETNESEILIEEELKKSEKLAINKAIILNELKETEDIDVILNILEKLDNLALEE